MNKMDNLLTFYQHRLNLQDATFLPIVHDDATVAVVYKVISPAGAPLILKICTRTKDYFNEVYFLKHFACTIPVPRIIQVVQPEAESYGAILMEHLPGTLVNAADFTDALAYEIGSLLARIHLNRAAGYGDLTQPDDLSSDPRDCFTMKFEEGLAECSNNLPHALIEQCRSYCACHIDLLTSVDGPCMTHRDFRAGNLLVRDGKVQGIIDWASARGGFAQEDFCQLEHGGWPTNSSNKKSFLAGYASIRPVPDYHDMMPLLRLGRAIAILASRSSVEHGKAMTHGYISLIAGFLKHFLNFSGANYGSQILNYDL